MSRVLELLLATALVAGLGAATWITRHDWLPKAGEHDGLPSTYFVRITDDGQYAEVEASIWMETSFLSLFDVQATPELPEGHVAMLRDLEVRDAEGVLLSPRYRSQGDWTVRAGQRVQLRYRVALDFDRYAWPAGAEEVAQRTDDGWLFKVSSLLLADGGDGIRGDIAVRFELPDGWRAVTPWPSAGEGFAPRSRREMLHNVIFLGRVRSDRIELEGLDVTVARPEGVAIDLAEVEGLLRPVAERYAQWFRAPPLQSEYLVLLVPGGSNDGGAFSNSFSQVLPADAGRDTRVIWGHTMAHELLHLWNGLAMVPATADEEWFKEGVTDYLTLTAEGQLGLATSEQTLRRLETHLQRQFIARQLLGHDDTLREAGHDKQAKRLLVYGGGAATAFAMDMAIREQSGDRHGLPDLMAALYARHRGPDQPYSREDIVASAKAALGVDLGDLLAASIDSESAVDVGPALAAAGLGLQQFAEAFHLRPLAVDAATAARREAVFGKMPVTRMAATATAAPTAVAP